MRKLFSFQMVVAVLAVFVVGSLLLSLLAIESKESSTMDISGKRIDINFTGGPFDLTPTQRLKWVSNAAEAVRTYYGEFPIDLVTLRVRGSDRNGIGNGKTFGGDEGEARITIRMGTESTEEDLKKDWELTHEMVHLAFPSVPEKNHWIEEGIATYVEPWARVQAGQLNAKKVWRDIVRDMPQGLPDRGDRGLDQTPTWGRIYWGGALYCLLADVEIHEKTNNKFGLREALRAINHAGNVSEDWDDLSQALEIGDKAVGVNVLENLYAKMKNDPYPVDLDALWKRLGVRLVNDEIEFDDTAPLANVRVAIEKKTS